MMPFSPSDPSFLENPFPFYKLGQAISPLFLPDPGMWLVFGYNDCVSILKDNKTWSSDFRILAPQRDEFQNPSMLNSDEPRHGQLRGLVSQAFTPRMVEQLEPRIREIARELLDAKVASGEMDFIEDFAYPLPVIMIAEIIGIPPEDRDRFKAWSNELVSLLGAGSPTEPPPMPEATIAEMREFFGKMVEERRREPKQDLISGLLKAEFEGATLGFEDMLQMLILLLVAGNETTTNLIGNAALEFLANPGELARLRGDLSLLPSALEEVLRLNSPVQAAARLAAVDTEINGKAIAKGQLAVAWLAAANRDPAIFPDADRFDIGRTPNRHLSFGMGVHFCLGAPLARLEAKVAFEEFFARVGAFERIDSEMLPRVPTFVLRGVQKLPLRVTST